MPKPAPRATAPAKKRLNSKPPTKAKKPAAPKKAARRAEPATAQGADERLSILARRLGLSEDEVLRRAVDSFAAAHGLADAPAAAPKVDSAPKGERAKSEPAKAPAPQPAADGEPPALAPAVRLYVHSNGRTPQEMIAARYVIGSSPKCDLWVNSPKIETRHLQLVREGDKYFAEDLDTAAGTVFDGKRIEGRHEIAHDDRLFLAGYHQVRFYLLS